MSSIYFQLRIFFLLLHKTSYEYFIFDILSNNKYDEIDFPGDANRSNMIGRITPVKKEVTIKPEDKGLVKPPADEKISAEGYKKMLSSDVEEIKISEQKTEEAEEKILDKRQMRLARNYGKSAVQGKNSEETEGNLNTIL